MSYLSLQTSLLSGFFDLERGYLLSMKERAGSYLPELIQAVYLHVRRPDWSTAMPVVGVHDHTLIEDGFSLTWNANVFHHGIGFQWLGKIASQDDGGFTYEVQGTTTQEFLTNRTGLCVLLPQELEGSLALTEKEGGPPAISQFPLVVGPQHPFTQFQKMVVQGWQLTFSGDFFEIEDQRNWGDASFKAYSMGTDHKPHLMPSRHQFSHRVTVQPIAERGSKRSQLDSSPIESPPRQFVTIPFHFQETSAKAPSLDSVTSQSELPDVGEEIKFSAHPQVHIFDDFLILRNAQSLRTVVRSLRFQHPSSPIHPYLRSSGLSQPPLSANVERLWALVSYLSACEGGADQVTFLGLASQTQNFLLEFFGNQQNLALARYPTAAPSELLHYRIGKQSLLINPTPVVQKLKEETVEAWSLLFI